MGRFPSALLKLHSRSETRHSGCTLAFVEVFPQEPIWGLLLQAKRLQNVEGTSRCFSKTIRIPPGCLDTSFGAVEVGLHRYWDLCSICTVLKTASLCALINTWQGSAFTVKTPSWPITCEKRSASAQMQQSGGAPLQVSQGRLSRRCSYLQTFSYRFSLKGGGVFSGQGQGGGLRKGACCAPPQRPAVRTGIFLFTCPHPLVLPQGLHFCWQGGKKSQEEAGVI